MTALHKEVDGVKVQRERENFMFIGLTCEKNPDFSSQRIKSCRHVPHQLLSQGKFSFMFSSFKWLPCLSYKQIQMYKSTEIFLQQLVS